MTLRPVLAFLPLVALCTLLSTRWMFIDRWPDAVPTAASQTCAALIACGLCACLAFLRRSRSSAVVHGVLPAFGAGALLFAGVNAGQLAGSFAPRSTDLTIALALTPVVILLAGTALGRSGTGFTGVALAPGILAPAGLLLLAPEPRLMSPVTDAVLLAAPLAVGLAAVSLTEGSRRLSPGRAAAAFGGAAVLTAPFWARAPHRPVSALAVALDVLTMLLVLGTLRALAPRGFAAQFAIVPFLSFGQYLFFAEIRPTWQQVAGLVALFASGALLLRPQRDAEETNSMGLFTSRV